jgi:hypothetical protein
MMVDCVCEPKSGVGTHESQSKGHRRLGKVDSHDSNPKSIISYKRMIPKNGSCCLLSRTSSACLNCLR